VPTAAAIANLSLSPSLFLGAEKLPLPYRVPPVRGKLGFDSISEHVMKIKMEFPGDGRSRAQPSPKKERRQMRRMQTWGTHWIAADVLGWRNIHSVTWVTAGYQMHFLQ